MENNKNENRNSRNSELEFLITYECYEIFDSLLDYLLRKFKKNESLDGWDLNLAEIKNFLNKVEEKLEDFLSLKLREEGPVPKITDFCMFCFNEIFFGDMELPTRERSFLKSDELSLRSDELHSEPDYFDSESLSEHEQSKLERKKVLYERLKIEIMDLYELYEHLAYDIKAERNLSIVCPTTLYDEANYLSSIHFLRFLWKISGQHKLVIYNLKSIIHQWELDFE